MTGPDRPTHFGLDPTAAWIVDVNYNSCPLFMHEQKAWINSRLLFMQWIAGEEKKKKKGGGRLTCDDGGLAGVKGSVVPVVVADGGWGGGLSSSPLCFSVLFSSSVFRSLCQHGFFLLCSGCVASLLFTVDHGGGGEARRQLLRFFLLPRVLPLSTTSSSLCFIPSPTLWFCWCWQRWWWWNGGAGWWWPKATVEREEQRWCPGGWGRFFFFSVQRPQFLFSIPFSLLSSHFPLCHCSSKILPPCFFCFQLLETLGPFLFTLVSFLLFSFPPLCINRRTKRGAPYLCHGAGQGGYPATVLAQGRGEAWLSTGQGSPGFSSWWQGMCGYG